MKAVQSDRWGALKRVFRCFLFNTVLALIPPFMLLSFVKNISAFRLLVTFGFSLVYAHSIGWLAFAVIPRVWVMACRFSQWVQWTVRIVVMFAVSTVGGLLACLIFVLLRWIPPQAYWLEFQGSFKIAAFLTILAGITVGLYESLRARLEETTLQLRTKELERERALKLATEAQLASLESRIHPHFLFNTLNSISSLIPEDPARAERLVEQMAALLRFSLDANQAGLVPLSRELQIVTDYLEIERARFGDRLRYQMDIGADLDEARIPPLAVQTLVENSVKYAIAPNRTGGEIRIAGARENGLLRVEISDEGPEFSLESAPVGHGLDNLKGRLSNLFGARAALTLERRERRNNIRLAVPQTLNGHESIPG
jgi:sensor histidine kinase YesM